MKKILMMLLVCLSFVVLVSCTITKTVTTSHVEKAKIVEVVEGGYVVQKVDFMGNTYYTIETTNAYKVGDYVYVDVYDDGSATLVKAKE